MASKQFEFALKLAAKLDASFGKAFRTANQELTSIRSKSRALKDQQQLLDDSLRAGTISIDSYRNATSKLGAELEKVQAKEKSLSNALKARNAAQANFRNARNDLASTTVMAAVAFAPIAHAAKVAASFEEAMSKVQAITGSTADEMKLLNDQAKELGAKTKFSARESAEAMTYLGMAGWKTEQILAGMPGLLDLAAAGGADLAMTADIVSDQLTAFGLAADQSSHMADVFAKTITATNTDISKLGETMKYAAPVANAFGVSLEETSALAGLMANSAIKGSQAGTALRSGFLRLAGSSSKSSKELAKMGVDISELTKEQNEARAALDSLGIAMSDSKGPRKMGAIIKDLADKTRGMTEEQKLNTLATIFGTNAASAWVAVINQGPEALDKLTTELENSDGTAKKMADTMQNNAMGAMTRLKSATESLEISIGGTLLPVIADFCDWLANQAAWLASVANEHQTLTKFVIVTAGAITGLVLAIKVARTAYYGFIAAKAALAVAMNTEIGLLVISQGMAAVAAAKTLLLTGATKAAAIGQWLWNASLLGFPLTWIVGGIALIVGFLVALYYKSEVVRNAMTQMWDYILMAIKAFVGAVTPLLMPFMKLLEKVGNITASLKMPDLGSIGSMSAEDVDVAYNAAGGIYGKGAFLTTFAEESGESAIPHKRNARNVALLAKTNAIMGNPLGGGGGMNVNYNPSITINGNADRGDVEHALASDRRRFEDMLSSYMAKQRRVTYE